MKVGEKFTLRDGIADIDLPDGGKWHAGHSYEVTKDNLELADKAEADDLVASKTATEEIEDTRPAPEPAAPAAPQGDQA